MDVYVLSVLVLVTRAQAALQVTVLGDTEVTLGDSATFTCSYTGVTDASHLVVKWIFTPLLHTKGTDVWKYDGDSNVDAESSNNGSKGKYSRQSTNINKAHSIELLSSEFSDEGNYNCKIEYYLDQDYVEKDGYLDMKVLVPPRNITVASPVIKEGHESTVTCTVEQVKPVAVELFLVNGSDTLANSTVQRSNAVNTLETVSTPFKVQLSRYDNGMNLSCVVKWRNQEFTQLFSVDVLFPPNGMESHNNLPVREGDLIDIQCETAASQPAADIIWMEGHTTLSSESITNRHVEASFNGIETRSELKIAAEREMNGKVIRCIPQHDNMQLTQLSKDIILNIHYVPTVKVETTKTSLRQGNNLNISCSAENGNPNSYTYKWWHKPYNQSYRGISNGQNSHLHLDNVDLTDAGMYKCDATNAAGRAEGTIQIVINYAPFPIRGSAPISLHSEIGVTRTFNLTVKAVPEPTTCVWSTTASTGTKKRTTQIILGPFSGDHYICQIEVTTESESDYGKHTVLITNPIGTLTLPVRLRLEGPPSAPTDLAIVDTTPNTVTITWTPGTDGGHTQTFQVLQSTGDSNFKQVSGKMSDPGNDERAQCLVTELESGQEYQFMVQATNGKGHVNSSIINATTVSGVLLAQAQSRNAFIYAGTVIAIVLVLGLVAIVLYVNVCRHRNKGSKTEDDVTMALMSPSSAHQPGIQNVYGEFPDGKRPEPEGVEEADDNPGDQRPKIRDLPVPPPAIQRMLNDSPSSSSESDYDDTGAPEVYQNINYPGDEENKLVQPRISDDITVYAEVDVEVSRSNSMKNGPVDATIYERVDFEAKPSVDKHMTESDSD